MTCDIYCTCMHLCMYMCMCTYVCIMYACMYACMYVSMYVCITCELQQIVSFECGMRRLYGLLLEMSILVFDEDMKQRACDMDP